MITMRHLIEAVAGGAAGTPLVEGRDAPLFHFTRLPILMEIIRSDRLGAGDGVSLTRDANTPYFSHGFWTHVALVLDQSQLAARYRIEPRSGSGYAPDFTLFQHGGEKHKYKEQEEFIAQPIAPLHDYLTHIVVSNDKIVSELLRHVRRLMSGKPMTKSFTPFREFVRRQLYRSVAYHEGQYRHADSVLDPENWRMVFDYCKEHHIVFTQQSLRITGQRGINVWHRDLP